MSATGTESRVAGPCWCIGTGDAFVPGSQGHMLDCLGAKYSEAEAVWTAVIPGSVDFQLSNH